MFTLCTNKNSLFVHAPTLQQLVNLKKFNVMVKTKSYYPLGKFFFFMHQLCNNSFITQKINVKVITEIFCPSGIFYHFNKIEMLKIILIMLAAHWDEQKPYFWCFKNMNYENSHSLLSNWLCKVGDTWEVKKLECEPWI